MHPKNQVKNRLKHLCLLIVASVNLSSCAQFRGPAYEAAKHDNKIFSTPLRAPKKFAQDVSTIHEGTEQNNQYSELQVFKTPSLTIEQAEEHARDIVMPYLPDTQVSRLSFNNLPVGAFINEVFGNQLGLNFVVEPSVKNTPDLITMRITKPVSQKDLYALATQTLKSYGVTTSLKDNVLIFNFSESTAGNETPILVSGRALPEVPSSSRPIFYIYPLTSVTTPMVRSWIAPMFPRKELEIKEDITRNALIFVGSQRTVEQALAATRLLDKPTMAGMDSRILKPSLSNVTDMASNLEQVLKSEGYSVKQGDGNAAIRLLPLESVGQLIIFAKSDAVLQHIIEWARQLEKRQYNKVENGLFSYQAQSTPAVHIVEVLNSLGVANYTSIDRPDSQSSSMGATGTTNSNSNIKRSNLTQNSDAKGRYAVDQQLNTILYSGSSKDWLQILPIIKKLDRPAPSVMVEVILAEVTLTDNEESGLEWAANAALGKFDLGFGTLDKLALGGKGFNLNLDSPSSTRAMLNAFYTNDKANIRSRPRLMVKSGGEASIEVGNEIPIITSNSQSTTSENAPVIQNITYRNTGILLDIKPTVHASGFVDIDISQELSEQGDGSIGGSPIILNRSLKTTVTLRDGGSVLLGGLISSTTSKGQQGVPVLGKLPLIGNLFSTDKNSQVRTELMIMIIPYVLNSPDEAERLTDDLQKARIDNLAIDIVPQESSSK
ncbi:type II and III secretion system protein [Neptunicella marina]|uniref:Type II and III secretion system protein n=1 Tax=Neptunicella marina TaxID=2125989 RepID=A0A8J6LXP5_9ALTE|nr:type II and III secretion system protein [Neptunicella marina]MBC3764945.1 type II and III secretion system protein [Neptunicella marina]